MSLRRRVKRLEEASAPEARQIPFLFVDVHGDGRAYADGRETTEEEWWAEYGEEIERERRRNPDRIFAVDFGCNGIDRGGAE